MASSSRTSPLYPPPAILPLATLQSSLGSFAGYLAPDPSELRTTFGCTHLGNSAETLTHLSSLSTQLKIEEENDSTLKPVNKSNMYSYHSQVYKRNKEPATPSGEIATQIAENVVDKLVSELFSWSGKRKQYKPAEYWINIMSVGDNDVERSSASISSIDLLPPSTFLSQILTITSTSPPPSPTLNPHHTLHSHQGSTHSSVYYLHTSLPSPLILRPYLNPENDTACYVPLSCYDDLGYYFKGDLEHAVGECSGEGTRISVAVNFFFGSGGGGYRPAY